MKKTIIILTLFFSFITFTGCDLLALLTGSVQNTDSDNDGIVNVDDNCPDNANPNQSDVDNDGIGDVCDPINDNNTTNNDDDGDGVVNTADNCPNDYNPDQTDSDNDGIGDVCDTSNPTGSLGDTLNAGIELLTKQYLESSNSKYTCTLQSDGNLILKNAQSGEKLWTSETAGSGAVKLKISSKGNLLMRNSAGVKVWSTDTVGATKLVLHDDGSLVLYAGSNEVWSSNGSGPVDNTTPILTFIAYGDSRTNDSTHKTICGLMDSENPGLVIHAGDLWDGYSSSIWKGHITSKSNLNKLLGSNKFLIAIGNHESSSEVKNFSPTIIKEGSTTYSFLQGNVFFVCLGKEPSASYLESQLKKSEAQKADFRIIFHHEPIYSGGSHGENGISSVEKICDQYNVTFSFAGHDHHYERSKVIYNQSSVYSGTNVPANTKGTTYIVTGGAGAPLYSSSSKWWTDTMTKKNHYCVLTSYSDRIEMTVKDKSGSVIEKFVRKK